MKRLLLLIAMMFSSFFTTSTLNLEAYSLIPGGENVGIEIKSNGVLVIGGYDVVTENDKYNPLKNSDIKKGDLIYQVNGQNIDSIKDLLTIISSSDDEYVTLSINRNNQEFSSTLKLCKTSKADTIKTGLLVKERILGIGTITFYDPNTHIYGALGHKLIDNDFASIADVNSGQLFASTVTGVNKSTTGNVGELMAKIDETSVLGSVYINSEYGVFGKYNKCPDKDALEVMNHEDIKLGKAYILTTLSENITEKYEINITSLEKQNRISTKGISLKITDKRLLDKTGGIVQGMSGSPIIQDGKLIGAVTHVLIDSVKKGYGIYMDYMLEMANIG